jgi:hypothetical protein
VSLICLPEILAEEVCHHVIDQGVQLRGALDRSKALHPAVEIFFPHKNLSANAMMGERTRPVN